MDELTRVLWEYASQYRLDGFYDRENQHGREECTRAVHRNREELEKACPPDVFKRVSAICDCSEELRLRDMEAAFACGFRLGSSLR
ncbi:MAG: hypothetical protein K2M42_04960 [Oscillospiraceae bacterium]|nr:hypothetical protein [Oscillospiraceae bacterium]